MMTTMMMMAMMMTMMMTMKGDWMVGGTLGGV